MWITQLDAFFRSSYSSMAGSGLYFVAMNYSVHALMYGYYCLQALKMCPKTFPAVLITLSQIAQMFVGTGVCCSAWYFTFFSKNSCHNDMSNLIAGALMYASYLYLFSEFAVKRYVGKSSSRTSKPSDPKKLEWLRDDIWLPAHCEEFRLLYLLVIVRTEWGNLVHRLPNIMMNFDGYSEVSISSYLAVCILL